MSYKDAQKAARVKPVVMLHESKQYGIGILKGTLDLGINRFKALPGKSKKEVKKFKEWAWSSR